MTKRFVTLAGILAVLTWGQTQVDLSRQVRKVLPYASGGTGGETQLEARTNVGTPHLVATDFAGADLGTQVNAAFASFPAGQCGTVLVPSGTYTYSTTIYVPTGCILSGAGRGNETGPFGTKLIYAGPPATAAVVLMKPDMSRSDWASVRDLSLYTNAAECPNNGMLKWNSGAVGSNKWQCYDGSSYSTPTAHLAGLLHGQIDPTVLSDGTHITVSNVDINGGGQNGDNNQQGGFHRGVWLNGCEECVLQSVYVKNADDGFSLGPSVNGVVLNQVTARLNRRSGIHVRGFNAIQAVLPLLEGNQWFGNAGTDPNNYGAGIRFDDEDLVGFGAGRSAGFSASGMYFEGNDVDVMTPTAFTGGAGPLEVSGFNSIRGHYLEAAFSGCSIPDAGLVTITGDVFHGCTITSGTFNFSGSAGRLFTRSGAWLQKLRRYTGAPGHLDVYEMIADPYGNPAKLHWRGPDYTYRILLENPLAADASANRDSPAMEFKGAKWTGSSTDFQWVLTAMAQLGNGPPEGTSGLYLYLGNTAFPENRRFAFREDGEFRILQPNAKITAGASGDDSLAVNASTTTFQAGTTSATRVTVKATGAQSSTSLQEWQTSDGVARSSIRADGSLQSLPSGSKPACAVGVRGTYWFTQGAAGVKDSVEVCAKDASGAYAWRTIY
jgi:hypothetical protein